MSGDAQFLLELRNDARSRAYSRNSQLIESSGHFEWLAATLVDPRVRLMIAESDGRRVGMIRVNHAATSAEVSWAVSADCRGRGFGTAMLRLAVDREATALYATIHDENIASQVMAAHAGFVRVTVDGIWTTWRRPPQDVGSDSVNERRK